MIDPTLVPALQDVLMVARAGSVGEASRRQHKTASAVSQQIRRVEQHFGVALFERAGRGVRLTASGESALPAINRLFDEAEATFGLLSELAGTSVTTLRVAASDYLGKGLLLPVLRGLSAERAPLRFEITTMHSLDAPRAVSRGEVDFAVITTGEAQNELAERVLFTQPFYWVAPRVETEKAPPRATRRRHEQAAVRVRRVNVAPGARAGAGAVRQRLAREPVLRLAAGSQGRRMLDAYLQQQRIRPLSTIDVPSVSLLLSYVSGGLGVGLAPALALREVPLARVARELATVTAVPVKLVFRTNFRLTPASAEFVDRVVAAGRAAAHQLFTLE